MDGSPGRPKQASLSSPHSPLHPPSSSSASNGGSATTVQYCTSTRMSVSVSPRLVLTCGHGKEACWPLAHENNKLSPLSFSSHKSSHHCAASPLNQMPGCYLLAQRPLLSTRSEPMVRSLCEHEHALLHRGPCKCRPNAPQTVGSTHACACFRGML